ncbi:hypothetical protein P3T39_007526 [Kitasatospora sp. GP82]|nr:hypothetical protein [Kitasatospora sp. GP82]
MDGPVFVIHGVGNRDEPAFEETVRLLRSQVGNALTL